MTNRIRKHRENKGISQRKLATLAGLNHKTIHNYEAGTTSPTVSCLTKISAALDVPLVDLLPAEAQVQPSVA